MFQKISERSQRCVQKIILVSIDLSNLKRTRVDEDEEALVVGLDVVLHHPEFQHRANLLDLGAMEISETETS